MKYESYKMTSIQFLLSVACHIQASTLLTAFFVSISKQDSWLVVIFGALICLPFLLVYCALMNKFKGMNLIDINMAVFGNIGGTLVSLCYCWFFLTLSSLTLLDFGHFVANTAMQQTPRAVVLSLFIVVCAWAVRGGLRTVVRYNLFFVATSICVTLTTIVLALNLMKLCNFLPILDLPLKSYINSAHVVATIPFGETVAFMMIAPFVKLKEGGDYKKYFLGGIGLGGCTLILVVARDNAVLGRMLSFFSMPTFETQRLVNLSKALSRMEVLFAAILMLLLFAKIILLFYVTSLALAQILRLQSYQPLVFSLAAFITIYSLILYDSSVQHAASAQQIVPIFWSFFEFLLPTATLIVAKLRKLPQSLQQSDSQQQGQTQAQTQTQEQPQIQGQPQVQEGS